MLLYTPCTHLNIYTYTGNDPIHRATQVIYNARAMDVNAFLSPGKDNSIVYNIVV